ncbi:MAG: VanZ family protein [Anaerolineales bacterium]|nr:VanZ family protein [Anaerolineales bacterium]
MKYIAILFFVFIITVIILANFNQIPRFVKNIYDFPYGDKAGHLVLFGLLNFFVTLSLIRALPQRDPKLVAVLTSLCLAFFIGVEEFSQKYFSTRTFDLLDLTASYIGLVVGGWLALLKK